MKIYIIATFLMVIGFLFDANVANSKTANQILGDIDKNSNSKTLYIKSTMVIHGKRITREITSESWIEGTSKSFTNFLSPPREKGVKMLKISNELWTYYPKADRIVKIAGHLLRQSVMGSDLSYEDMLEDQSLAKQYNAVKIGQEKYLNLDATILELTAKNANLNYFKRKIWVAETKNMILKEQLFGKSGKLLKSIEVKEYKKQNDRWFANHAVYKDELSDGKGTEFKVGEIEFDASISPSKFKKSALRR